MENKKIKCCRGRKTVLAVFALASVIFSSCSKKSEPLIIWTSRSEIVSYVELFNSTHTDVKAVVVYKEETARSLPPAKDELSPDIVIAPWLKNSATRKNFVSLDYLFQDRIIDRELFYPLVLDYGVINEKQYLLPVSFNLPLMIYSKKNEKLVKTDHYLSLDQIQNAASSFNELNKSSAYTAMGFAPSWNSEFLYQCTKLNGVSYREKGTSFAWDNDQMISTVDILKNWTSSKNTDTSAEQNFQFRYLYMPVYRQVTTGRCLFGYVSSSDFFTLSDAQSSGLTFRWLSQDEKIPVQDDIVTMGIYKGGKHVSKAEKFIEWFMTEQTQRDLIARAESMKLDTLTFGIAGGFSSIKDVTDKYYPAYYRSLLGNLPPEKALLLPRILPPRWKNLKANVIVPYLTDSTKTDMQKAVTPLEERINEWNKQFY